MHDLKLYHDRSTMPNDFEVGSAIMDTKDFLYSGFFVGIVGEYVGAIHGQVLKRPLVIEKEWINFDWMIGAIQDCYLLPYLRIEF